MPTVNCIDCGIEFVTTYERMRDPVCMECMLKEHLGAAYQPPEVRRAKFEAARRKR